MIARYYASNKLHVGHNSMIVDIDRGSRTLRLPAMSRTRIYVQIVTLYSQP